MIERALFVIAGTDSARRFLSALPELRQVGLSELTVVHLLPAGRGPAEPMADLAHWIRNFESVVPTVELRLKRGDPVRWISELARVRRAQLVVLAEEPTDTWLQYLERVSSPLRHLGVPILLLSSRGRPGPLFERIAVAVKSPVTLDRVASDLQTTLDVVSLVAVHVLTEDETAANGEPVGTNLVAVIPANGIASTLLDFATRERATLLVLMAEEPDIPASEPETPVVRHILLDAHLPILIWPYSTG